jgi:hypothetical protein
MNPINKIMKKQKTILPPKHKLKEPVLIDLKDFNEVLKRVISAPPIRKK